MGWPKRVATSLAGSAALILSGCSPQAGILLGGIGPGPTAQFSVVHAVYHFHWTVRDVGATDHGCLIGLAIEQTQSAEPPVRWGTSDVFPKLTYRTIGAGARVVGDATVQLDAGTYLIRSQGTCAWEAQILPAGPDETPINGIVKDGSNEQAG